MNSLLGLTILFQVVLLKYVNAGQAALTPEEIKAALKIVPISLDDRFFYNQPDSDISGNKDNEIESRSWIDVDSRLWENGIIPYEIRDTPPFDDGDKESIAFAISQIEDNTCIRFVPYNSSEHTSNLSFRKTHWSKCFASGIGRRRDNYVGLGWCSKGGIYALHEVLHVLGAGHEHNRPDRNEIITMHWDQIVRSRGYQGIFKWYFRSCTPAEVRNSSIETCTAVHRRYTPPLEDWTVFDRCCWKAHVRAPNPFPYDIYSIMHYPSWDWVNHITHMTLNSDPTQKIRFGMQNKYLTQGDKDDLNFRYGCQQKNLAQPGTSIFLNLQDCNGNHCDCRTIESNGFPRSHGPERLTWKISLTDEARRLCPNSRIEMNFKQAPFNVAGNRVRNRCTPDYVMGIKDWRRDQVQYACGVVPPATPWDLGSRTRIVYNAQQSEREIGFRATVCLVKSGCP